MDPKRFYGSKAKVCSIRDIPAESDDSELSTDDEEEELLQEVSDESSVSEQEDEGKLQISSNMKVIFLCLVIIFISVCYILNDG
jgi:hypothetical protein